MSYDIYFVRRDPGQSFEDALDATEESFEGDPGPLSPVELEQWDEVLPVARNLAEIRGLLNQAIRRLERLEGDILAERHARLDDLGLLVDLVSSGWKGVSDRLGRVEHAIDEQAATEHPPYVALRDAG